MLAVEPEVLAQEPVVFESELVVHSAELVAPQPRSQELLESIC